MTAMPYQRDDSGRFAREILSLIREARENVQYAITLVRGTTDHIPVDANHLARDLSNDAYVLNNIIGERPNPKPLPMLRCNVCGRETLHYYCEGEEQ